MVRMDMGSPGSAVRDLGSRVPPGPRPGTQVGRTAAVARDPEGPAGARARSRGVRRPVGARRVATAARVASRSETTYDAARRPAHHRTPVSSGDEEVRGDHLPRPAGGRSPGASPRGGCARRRARRTRADRAGRRRPPGIGAHAAPHAVWSSSPPREHDGRHQREAGAHSAPCRRPRCARRRRRGRTTAVAARARTKAYGARMRTTRAPSLTDTSSQSARLSGPAGLDPVRPSGAPVVPVPGAESVGTARTPSLARAQEHQREDQEPEGGVGDDAEHDEHRDDGQQREAPATVAPTTRRGPAVTDRSPAGGAGR